MQKPGLLTFLSLLGISSCFAQIDVSNKDTTVNNLQHINEYITSEIGAIPQYKKIGKGKQTLMLIAGMGFDASIFNDFLEANKKKYTMYAITVPGYGKTPAPPMPDSIVSYGEQPWTRSAEAGIIKLINQEKIESPILIGHFVLGTQLALRLAIDYPDKIKGVIIFGGAAKMLAIIDNKLINQPVSDMIRGVDKYYAPKWFKTMRKDFFDNGNFPASVYSLNQQTGTDLWKSVAEVPMPVSVRYSCEYFASDITTEIEKIKCPVLVLRPQFTESFWENTMLKNWIQPQFIESWNIAAKANTSIKIADIPNSATFVWKDKPNEVNNKVREFIMSLKK